MAWTNTSTIYVPKIQDWVDYYGGGHSQTTHTIQACVGGCVDDQVFNDPSPNTTQHVQVTPDIKTTNISVKGDEMSTGIQVLSPVQAAVNQAMATKRRRARGGGKKKKKVVKKKVGRRKKPKKKTKVGGKRRRKKVKTQRDIFNY
jgi:hypothetical protein